MGLGTQLVALGMLALMPPSALTVAYVMASQALSGIAKDLTKMSSKSAVKLVAGDSEGRLYRWVALLTGSKNALKGVGFFLGSLLLSIDRFPDLRLDPRRQWSAVALVLAAILMRGGLGEANKKAKFRHLFSRNRAGEPARPSRGCSCSARGTSGSSSRCRSSFPPCSAGSSGRRADSWRCGSSATASCRRPRPR